MPGRCEQVKMSKSRGKLVAIGAWEKQCSDKERLSNRQHKRDWEIIGCKLITKRKQKHKTFR